MNVYLYFIKQLFSRKKLGPATQGSKLQPRWLIGQVKLSFPIDLNLSICILRMHESR